MDDKRGHERRWICNGFIAVVKILKVSEKSALTRPVKIEKKKKNGREKALKSILIEEKSKSKAGEEDEY